MKKRLLVVCLIVAVLVVPSTASQHAEVIPLPPGIIAQDAV